MGFVGGLSGGAVGAGAGEGLRVQPSENIILGIANGRLFSGPEFTEPRAFAVETPDFQRVSFYAEHVGGLLIGEEFHFATHPVASFPAPEVRRAAMGASRKPVQLQKQRGASRMAR
tara:strand:+ start:8044 stop:8391 length:348 start_codon:yes stop_codon:yes gene_type:complete